MYARTDPTSRPLFIPYFPKINILTKSGYTDIMNYTEEERKLSECGEFFYRRRRTETKSKGSASPAGVKSVGCSSDKRKVIQYSPVGEHRRR